MGSFCGGCGRGCCGGDGDDCIERRSRTKRFDGRLVIQLSIRVCSIRVWVWMSVCWELWMWVNGLGALGRDVGPAELTRGSCVDSTYITVMRSFWMMLWRV